MKHVSFYSVSLINASQMVVKFFSLHNLALFISDSFHAFILTIFFSPINAVA